MSYPSHYSVQSKRQRGTGRKLGFVLEHKDKFIMNVCLLPVRSLSLSLSLVLSLFMYLSINLFLFCVTLFCFFPLSLSPCLAHSFSHLPVFSLPFSLPAFQSTTPSASFSTSPPPTSVVHAVGLLPGQSTGASSPRGEVGPVQGWPVVTNQSALPI